MIDNLDTYKIIVSNNADFGKKCFKYFIGHKDHDKVKPIGIILLRMSVYRKRFNEKKHATFLIKDDGLLEK